MTAKLRVSLLVFAGFTIGFTLVFSPALTPGNFLTSGDGVSQGIPTFFGRMPLIEPRMMLGYPLFADPNQAFWYPVLRIMRAIPGAFNSFAIFPFVLVAFGTYGFARNVSGSLIGGIIAGITVALGGFMIGHQAHLMIIHPACWTPFVLWSIASLRERSSRLVIVSGSVALALGLMAGTQQAVVYLVFIGCVYAFVFRPQDRKLRTAFFRDVALVLVFGVALAAISLVPASEFALRTDRAHQTLAEFSVFSTGVREFPIRTLFPFLLGGSASATYARPFPPLGAFTEATNYAGIVTLVLGTIALLDSTLRRRAFFWFGVAGWSAWMATGTSLGAAPIARLIPIYGSFRIPGRHAFEWTFAVGILASLGVAAMQSGRVSWRCVVIATCTVATTFTVALVALALAGPEILASIGSGIAISAIPPLEIAADRALWLPACILAGACTVVILWKLFPTRWFAVVVLASVACDMLVFAYGSYWHDFPTSVAIVHAPADVARLRARLQRDGGRYLDLGGETTHRIAANLATLWQLPNTTGYVSLEDRSFEDLFKSSPTGVVAVPFAAQGEATTLDLTGVRYLLIPPDPPPVVPIASALGGDSIDGFISDPMIASQQRVGYALSKAQTGDALQIVTALGNSIAVADRAHVADVLVKTANRVMSFTLLAGRDTSESAYDRPDVRPIVKYARAEIFSGSEDAHLYLATFSLPPRTVVQSVSIDWNGRAEASGALTIAHIAVIDRARGLAYPFYADGEFTQDPSHFVDHADVFASGGERVLENRRAFAHVWIVNRLIAAPLDVQLRAVHAGKLGGTAVDFHHTALAAQPLTLGGAGSRDRATILLAEPTFEIDEVMCANACLLVTGDLWYPGWNATVDGVATPVLPVDYALRGIAVPAGTHRITTWFAPWSLGIGLMTSVAAGIFLIAFVILGGRNAKHMSQSLTRDDDYAKRTM